MVDTVLRFYEELAEDYHQIFADWKTSLLHQTEVLDHLIRAHLGAGSHSVLDCSCGIGTQAIGLAMHGYSVHATDLSPTAVSRAMREAKALGASLSFGVADLRALATQVQGEFDVVLSCDNSLPHLLSDEDLSLAALSMLSKLRPGGLMLASIRDYDRLAAEKPRTETPRVYDGAEGRRIVFQVWDWSSDGRTYHGHLFIVRQVNGAWSTSHYSTVYRALRQDELRAILQDAGFENVRWQTPEESGYYQPVVTARKR